MWSALLANLVIQRAYYINSESPREPVHKTQFFGGRSKFKFADLVILASVDICGKTAVLALIGLSARLLRRIPTFCWAMRVVLRL